MRDHRLRAKRVSSASVSASGFAPDTESGTERFIAAVQDARRIPSSADIPFKNAYSMPAQNASPAPTEPLIHPDGSSSEGTAAK